MTEYGKREVFFAAWVEGTEQIQFWFSIEEDQEVDVPLLFHRREDLVRCVRDYDPSLVLRKIVPIKIRQPLLKASLQEEKQDTTSSPEIEMPK